MHTIIMQKNIGHHARLKENEHLFRYQAQLEGNYLHCVCARATLRALMTQKSCAVGMRNNTQNGSKTIPFCTLCTYSPPSPIICSC